MTKAEKDSSPMGLANFGPRARPALHILNLGAFQVERVGDAYWLTVGKTTCTVNDLEREALIRFLGGRP